MDIKGWEINREDSETCHISDNHGNPETWCFLSSPSKARKDFISYLPPLKRSTMLSEPVGFVDSLPVPVNTASTHFLGDTEVCQL